MRWEGGDEDVVGGGDVDDDPDGTQRDDDDDGDDFPLREGISPADLCLAESFLLSVWFPPWDGGGNLFWSAPPLILDQRDVIRQGVTGRNLIKVPVQALKEFVSHFIYSSFV